MRCHVTVNKQVCWVGDFREKPAEALSPCAQVPIWFCVACPVVLGLMAPFLFNLGSGAVAQALCDRFALPADECNDVW